MKTCLFCIIFIFSITKLIIITTFVQTAKKAWEIRKTHKIHRKNKH